MPTTQIFEWKFSDQVTCFNMHGDFDIGEISRWNSKSYLTHIGKTARGCILKTHQISIDKRKQLPRPNFTKLKLAFVKSSSAAYYAAQNVVRCGDADMVMVTLDRTLF